MNGDITPRFKLIFVTVVVLTVALLVGGVFVGIQANPTDQAIKISDALLDLGKAGVGSIFGLLGGKAL